MKTLCSLLVIAFLPIIFSCKKQSDKCYDEQLYQNHKNDICTADCPKVIGCDGKVYCNQCEAQKSGIQLKQ